MRGPATERSRAKRGLLQRRDHVGPWPARKCSARCRRRWRMRCEIDARLYAGDRSPVPPSRPGPPDRCPPGSRSNSPTAPLPPPVIASAALRSDACKVEINCCHAASDGLMVREWSEAEKYLANGETQFGQCQQAEETDDRPAAAPRRYRRRRG